MEQPNPFNGAVAVDLLDLERDVYRDSAPLRCLEHLTDRQLMGPESLASVDELDVGGGVEQVDHPVAGGVPTTYDHHALAREDRLLADDVVRAPAFPAQTAMAMPTGPAPMTVMSRTWWKSAATSAVTAAVPRSSAQLRRAPRGPALPRTRYT